MVGHPERARRRAVAEQALALAEHDRRDHQGQFVEQAGVEQLRIERAAALDDQVRAVALLDRRAAPRWSPTLLAVFATAGRRGGSRHVWCRHRTDRGFRPSRRAHKANKRRNLIGSAAKQQLIRATEQFAHLARRCSRRRPGAASRCSGSRRSGPPRTAWTLDHAIERGKGGADDLTHRQSRPRSAASILAMSIFRIVIIASNARLAAALSGLVLARAAHAA